MQLNDILEENSVKAIGKKTKISENNLENLLEKRFENLKKVKTLGFISILEREYAADLTALREEAYAYYNALNDDKSVMLSIPIVEEKREKSKIFLFAILLLLGYATWYFLTQFDKKNLSELIPFIDKETLQHLIGNSEDTMDNIEDLSIAKISKSAMGKKSNRIVSKPVQAEKMTNEASVEVTETVMDITPPVNESLKSTPVAIEKKSISIVPQGRLWFGVIDMQTHKRDNTSISKPFQLDVTSKSWLVATSSAPFSLVVWNETKYFSDAQEHYFKIDANGIENLSKSDYVALGGWPQW